MNRHPISPGQQSFISSFVLSSFKVRDFASLQATPAWHSEQDDGAPEATSPRQLENPVKLN